MITSHALPCIVNNQYLEKLDLSYNYIHSHAFVLEFLIFVEKSTICWLGFEGNVIEEFSELLRVQELRNNEGRGLILSISERAPKSIVKKVFELNSKAIKMNKKKGKNKK